MREDAIPTKFCFVKPKTERAPPKVRLAPKPKVRLPVPVLYCEKSSAVAEGLEVENSSARIETNCGLEIANTNPSSSKETQTNRTENIELLLQGKVRELETELETLESKFRSLKIEKEAKQFCVKNLSKDDKLFKFYTGFSYDQFRACFQFFGEAVSYLGYRGVTSDYELVDKSTKRGPCRNLSPENEFLLVLTRLKVGLLEQDLATRFEIHQSTVSRIVTTWISFMYDRFKELDIWPSRQQCNENMPEHVRRLYPRLRCIIDATEIYIEKPSNPIAQQATFSSYKNRNTLKILVGIDPSGSISFISDLYGGSISDRELTIKCGILEEDWESQDVLMADRGFNVQDLFEDKEVRLNIPPFLNGKEQLSEYELVETRRIASIRIHIERAIERIKNYHILDYVPISMCQNKLIDQLFFVCGMLTNFQPPLIQ